MSRTGVSLHSPVVGGEHGLAAGDDIGKASHLRKGKLYPRLEVVLFERLAIHV